MVGAYREGVGGGAVEGAAPERREVHAVERPGESARGDARAGKGGEHGDGVAGAAGERPFAAHGDERAGVGEDGRVGDLFGEVEQVEDVRERVVLAQSGRAEEDDGECAVGAGE